MYILVVSLTSMIGLCTRVRKNDELYESSLQSTIQLNR